jgi:endonuclease/exonuclease/phosphatase family metal-dependent hydrolase
MTKRVLSYAALAVVIAGCTLGCRNQQGKGGASGARGLRQRASRAIVVDGIVKEWPRAAAVVADDDSLYFRVTIDGQPAPLQASPETLAFWLDLDGRAETGARMPAPADAATLGIDAMIEFSPRDAEGKPRTGGVVYSVESSGVRAPLPAAAVELIAAPTFGADTYEVRLSRHLALDAAPALAGLLSSAGRGRAMYILSDSAGKPVGWSKPERFSMPAAAPARPLADAGVPAKPAGAIRVLSYNVLNKALIANPSSFARILQVAQPDIVLLQEWDTDEATARAWFTAVITGEHPWYAVAAEDCVIVSSHPIQKVGPEQVITDESMGGEPRPVRVVGGLVRTPLGNVTAVSLHLKCCGTAGSPEDQRRLAEARAINAAFAQSFQSSGARMTVMGGDFNLVGSRTPIDAARMRLDLDGSELAPADAFVLGDAAMYTWRDPAQPFPPGRLDYLLYSDSAAEVVNAFILDTARLSERALARLGLDSTDTAASDHLPLVVDLRPR